MITRKSKGEIDTMRAAGKVVAEVHRACREASKAGVSTWEVDQLAESIVRDAGGVPTFKGYNGFPATICASINEEVVHGIPSKKRILQEGDIFSLDVGCTLEGLVADAALTFAVGDASEDAIKLMDVTKGALFAGLDAARPGNRISDISHAVEAHINKYGLGIVRDYGGHGVGHRLHEEPHIPNHGKPGVGPRIKPGYCLAIEPMVNLGSDDVKTLADRWTVVTSDGKWSAHFEHSLAVTPDGPLLLTLPEGAEQPFLGNAIL